MNISMIDTINKLEGLLNSVRLYIAENPESEMSQKDNLNSWSKKEILGHLVDSGINNLQRFTEIQFESKPYKIRKYNQDALVIANDYQNSETKEIVEFLIAVNNRIKNIMNRQTVSSLYYQVVFDDETMADLRLLMTDYVEHFEHHLKQIMNNN